MTTSTATRPLPSLSALHEVLSRELGARPRTRYVMGLLLTLTGGLALVTMWATEPGSLPGRTHAAFAALVLLDLVWAGFFARALSSRPAWFGHPRVAAATIGVVASVVWLGFALAIVTLRGAWPLGWTAVVCASSFVVVAARLRHQAVREVERLGALARELERLIVAQA